MHALIAVAMDEKRNALWRQYMADVGWIMARIWSRDDRIPRYTETELDRVAAADTRSADEIKRDLKRKLMQ